MSTYTIWCKKCNHYCFSAKDDDTLLEDQPYCCGIRLLTMGRGKCCYCNKQIEVDDKTPDICLECSLNNMELKNKT